MSGKGDRPRHNLAKYADGWERIFGGDGKSKATEDVGTVGVLPQQLDGGSTPPTSRMLMYPPKRAVRELRESIEAALSVACHDKLVEQSSNQQTRPSWGKRRQQAAQDRSC